jgi:hypothetical protein
MTQPEESREKTASTDAVLMHPDNDPSVETAGAASSPEPGEVRVERDGRMVPVDEAYDEA